MASCWLISYSSAAGLLVSCSQKPEVLAYHLTLRCQLASCHTHQPPTTTRHRPMETTDPQADNPCWGGPEPHLHDLQYLLSALAQNTAPITSQKDHASFLKQIHLNLIVFQDDNYLVINKPPDLRMDGPYRASVHKLLLYLFPLPSLLPASSDEPESSTYCTDTTKIKDESSSVQNTTSNHFKNHTELLQKISSLSKHSCLKDDPFRIVHQLDYATSGILLYATNKRAAGVACRAFQERQTNKQYVAVVIEPDINSTDSPFGSSFFDSLPKLPESSLKQWGDGSLENEYRKKRKRETEDRCGKKNTFDGFMPVHSVFAKWRGMLLRFKKDKEPGGTQPSQHSAKKKYDPLPRLPEIKPPLTNEEVDEVLSYGASWKAVKGSKDKHSRCWVPIIEEMAKEYNQLLAEFHARKDEMDTSDNAEADEGGSSPLPPLFRIQSDDDDSTCSGSYGDSFYICASIGEPKDGRFEVLVDPTLANPLNKDKIEESVPLPEMKPSLTKCTVLWRGQLQIDNNKSIPVTKVLLKPWTGRRHQLRVHLAQVAGFPILGDVTYGGNVEVKGTNPNVADDGIYSPDATRVACRRMCLHARQLSIPLMDGELKSFEAPDPFVIAKRLDCEGEILQVL